MSLHRYRNEQLPPYLVRCCSCEIPMDPEREAERGVCLNCNQPVCDLCAVSELPLHGGLCYPCWPEKPEEKELGDMPSGYWEGVNRKLSEKKERAAAGRAKRDREKRIKG